ncbi:MAG: hypothetical protein SVO01_07905 [Thermotogota bacterium]|nr:hypothetical protein [Thermotogota bacterium]
MTRPPKLCKGANELQAEVFEKILNLLELDHNLTMEKLALLVGKGRIYFSQVTRGRIKGMKQETLDKFNAILIDYGIAPVKNVAISTKNKVKKQQYYSDPKKEETFIKEKRRKPAQCLGILSNGKQCGVITENYFCELCRDRKNRVSHDEIEYNFYV